jgi:hypothetical protein
MPVGVLGAVYTVMNEVVNICSNFYIAGVATAM